MAEVTGGLSNRFVLSHRTLVSSITVHVRLGLEPEPMEPEHSGSACKWCIDAPKRTHPAQFLLMHKATPVPTPAQVGLQALSPSTNP